MSAEESRNGNTVATSADPARGQITVKNPKSSDSEAAKKLFI